MQYFIDVILPIPIERYFTYSISKKEAQFIQVGARVAVPFGKSKIYTAIVQNKHQNPPLQYEAKEIHQILDELPIVVTSQLQLWEWISSYYMCTVGEVMRAALPSALLLESETQIVKHETHEAVNEANLTNEEFLVYEALEHQSSLKIDEVGAIIDRKNALPVIKGLLDKNIIDLHEKIYEKYKPKLVRYVSLIADARDEQQINSLFDSLNKNATKQAAILTSYLMLSNMSNEFVKVKTLLDKSEATSAQVKALIDKNILKEELFQEDRVRFEGDNELQEIRLNSNQTNTLNNISELFKNKEVILFKGVTASGKTEVYIQYIKKVLSEDKQVLYLVPEIALTTQLVQRLERVFGSEVAVFHSRFSQNERVEVYQKLLNQTSKAKLVIGARSSVLLPFNNLGLIVVDEEHEASYKQFDPAPRYHARDVAIVLANMHKAKVILGSATPSLESYYNAQNGKFGLVTLNKRFHDVLMPEIELVDLADKYKRKRMQGHFSDRLIEELTECLDNGFQAILFQNRRGYAPIVTCNTCGHVPQCPNCDVSLTYHQYRDQLRCHYCSHTIAMQKQCMACGNADLDSKGFGTEQIEQEVSQLFPEARVGRMDLDTTRGKYSYKKIIRAFEEQEYQILVGTQMLSKGLDFSNVKLVGIMNADLLLNYPDFRAHERSFQLLQQVSGRAGRTNERGKVLIQTYNSYHRILQQVSTNSYDEMYQEQLEQRNIYKYPPHFRMIRISFVHKDYNKVNDGSDWFAKSLRQHFGNYVLGPEFPQIARIRNKYYKNVLLKIPKKQSLSKTKEAVSKIKNSFLNISVFRPIKVILNVDYY